MIVLAAGKSRRYGRRNKLTALLRGQPLVRHVVAAAVASRGRPVIVVRGYQRRRVDHALRGLRRRFSPVFNPAYAAGMGTSLAAGLARVPAQCSGAVVCLGDMPHIRRGDIDALINAYVSGDQAVVPVAAGRRAHPVLLSRGLFPAVAKLQGEVGARMLLRDMPRVREIPAGRRALLDVDRVRALQAPIRHRS